MQLHVELHFNLHAASGTFFSIDPQQNGIFPAYQVSAEIETSYDLGYLEVETDVTSCSIDEAKQSAFNPAEIETSFDQGYIEIEELQDTRSFADNFVNITRPRTSTNPKTIKATKLRAEKKLLEVALQGGVKSDEILHQCLQTKV